MDNPDTPTYCVHVSPLAGSHSAESNHTCFVVFDSWPASHTSQDLLSKALSSPLGQDVQASSPAWTAAVVKSRSSLNLPPGHSVQELAPEYDHFPPLQIPQTSEEVAAMSAEEVPASQAVQFVVPAAVA